MRACATRGVVRVEIENARPRAIRTRRLVRTTRCAALAERFYRPDLVRRFRLHAEQSVGQRIDARLRSTIRLQHLLAARELEPRRGEVSEELGERAFEGDGVLNALHLPVN